MAKAAAGQKIRVEGKTPSYGAPIALRARIKAALREGTPKPLRFHFLGGESDNSRELRPCAALLILAGIGRGNGARQNRVTHEVISNHVRSLLPGHLTDVASPIVTRLNLCRG